MNHMIQPLEDRRLLTATLGDDGVLTVEGTAAGDNIVITVDADGDLVVRESRLRRFGRFLSSAAATETTFEAADVASIVVNAGAGNDNVSFKVSRSYDGEPIPVTINGGAGNDWLSASGGDDSISGGEGDDNIHGGGGADTLLGEAGDDNLSGGDDDDSLDGGDGEDKVAGGEGVDTINGGAGDDLLVAVDGETTDVIDGGDDTAADGEDDADVAIVDTDEAAQNATALTLDDLPRGGHGHGGGHGDGHGFRGPGFGFSRRRIF